MEPDPSCADQLGCENASLCIWMWGSVRSLTRNSSLCNLNSISVRFTVLQVVRVVANGVTANLGLVCCLNDSVCWQEFTAFMLTS